jgi:hypothetical protein
MRFLIVICGIAVAAGAAYGTNLVAGYVEFRNDDHPIGGRLRTV